MAYTCPTLDLSTRSRLEDFSMSLRILSRIAEGGIEGTQRNEGTCFIVMKERKGTSFPLSAIDVVIKIITVIFIQAPFFYYGYKHKLSALLLS